MDDPKPFEISTTDSGSRLCDNGEQRLLLVGAEGSAFRRRAVSSSGLRSEWAVAELDGVRVYFDGSKVTVTREDIYP